MSSRCFIVTSTYEIGLASLREALPSRGNPVTDPEAVRRINESILKSRGQSPTSPIASPSFRAKAEEISAISGEIAALVSGPDTPAVMVGEAFPLTIGDWASAGPSAILCLTTGESPEIGGSAIGEEPPACRQAFKFLQLHQLANAGLAAGFLNVEGMTDSEMISSVEDFLHKPAGSIEPETELESVVSLLGGGPVSSGSKLFGIRPGTPLERWVHEELEHWHQRQVQQAALRDRDEIYEKESNRRAG